LVEILLEEILAEDQEEIMKEVGVLEIKEIIEIPTDLKEIREIDQKENGIINQEVHIIKNQILEDL
jgi:hypothetical protein